MGACAHRSFLVGVPGKKQKPEACEADSDEHLPCQMSGSAPQPEPYTLNLLRKMSGTVAPQPKP